MKAVILAAGRGSRLGALTDRIPKALVAFNGRTLLERAIQSLRAGGADEIGIVTGYRADLVARHADRAFTNIAWDTSGIFQSLSGAAAWLAEAPCLVSYGDIFYSPDVVERLVRSTADIAVAYDPRAVALWRHRFDEPLQDLERFRIVDGRIVDIGGRAATLDEIQGQYMGLFRLTPSGWRRLVALRDALQEPRRSNVDMTSLFAAAIAAGQPITGVPTAHPWGEIDRPEDLQLYERLYPAL